MQSCASVLAVSKFDWAGSTSLPASSHFFSLRRSMPFLIPSKTALPALYAFSPCSLMKIPALIHLPPY
jgi:hypothetical protein